ncbi:MULTISPECIES: DUF7683 domain-containing protein [unclassified Streptomyces]|uniref:DUF7683 domain-containing protein n=1 Tax=unclassified Streptomyces TaxID=2593676 RepID=UPI003D717D11
MILLLTRYTKDGDLPDATTDVTAVGAEALGAVLGVPADRLVDVYPLTRAHAARLQQLTGIPLDPETYDYFLEPGAE